MGTALGNEGTGEPSEDGNSHPLLLLDGEPQPTADQELFFPRQLAPATTTPARGMEIGVAILHLPIANHMGRNLVVRLPFVDELADVPP